MKQFLIHPQIKLIKKKIYLPTLPTSLYASASAVAVRHPHTPAPPPMKVCALVSGGKDSVFSMMECARYGHEVVVLANLYPLDAEAHEIDSFMYQTAAHHAIEALGACAGLPMVRRQIHGRSVATGIAYELTAEDEVEDLFELLRDVQARHPEVDAVCSGAILSTYQRVRVEHVCARLGLTSLSYLWQRDQAELLREMIDSGLEAVLVKVACMGLKPAHLGRDLGAMEPLFARNNARFGMHVCGEGGEYETMTVDAPIFVRRMILEQTTVEVVDDDEYAPVALLRIAELRTESKPGSGSSGAAAAAAASAAASAPSTTASAVPPVPPAPSTATLSAALPSVSELDGRICVTGVVARDAANFATLGAEVEAVLASLRERLLELDAALEDCLHIRLYLSEGAMRRFGEVNAMYCRYFGDNPPSRSCVSARLAAPHRVALSCVAQRGSHADRGAGRRATLHVQSISRWAPTCIGPYSQANVWRGMLHLAGQIALDPPTMALISGGVEAEARLALRNCSAVLDVLITGGSPGRHVGGSGGGGGDGGDSDDSDEGADAALGSLSTVALAIAFVGTGVDAAALQRVVSAAWPGGAAALPPLLIVEVPLLPRGAAVEFEMLALNDVVAAAAGGWSSRRRRAVDTPSPRGDLAASGAVTSSDAGGEFCAATASVSASASDGPADAAGAGALLVETLGAALAASALPWRSVRSIHAYSAVGALQPAALESALRAALAALGGEADGASRIALSVVGVDALGWCAVEGRLCVAAAHLVAADWSRACWE